MYDGSHIDLLSIIDGCRAGLLSAFKFLRINVHSNHLTAAGGP